MSDSVVDKAEECQNEIIAQMDDFIEQRGVKEQVVRNAQDMASVACQHILDPSKDQLKTFDGTPAEKEFELMLIYDFLKQSGFQFTSAALKFESQHPELIDSFDRRKFGKDSHLCTYDKTPYLVQIIREIQRSGL